MNEFTVYISYHVQQSAAYGDDLERHIIKLTNPVILLSTYNSLRCTLIIQRQIASCLAFSFWTEHAFYPHNEIGTLDMSLQMILSI